MYKIIAVVKEQGPRERRNTFIAPLGAEINKGDLVLTESGETGIVLATCILSDFAGDADVMECFRELRTNELPKLVANIKRVPFRWEENKETEAESA